jgi:hypothetical protein
MSKFSMFLRSGREKNSNLELIYNNIIGALGSAFTNAKLVQIEMLAYAKAIHEITLLVNEHINNIYLPTKFTYNLHKLAKELNIDFLSPQEQLEFISILLPFSANTANLVNIDVALRQLSPLFYNKIWINSQITKKSKSGWVEFQPYIDSNKKQAYTIDGTDSYWYSSLMQLRVQLNPIPVQNINYKTELRKITAFLNYVLPSYCNYNIIQHKGFILGGTDFKGSLLNGTNCVMQIKNSGISGVVVLGSNGYANFISSNLNTSILDINQNIAIIGSTHKGMFSITSLISSNTIQYFDPLAVAESAVLKF